MVKVTEDILPKIHNNAIYLDNCPTDLPSPAEVLAHPDVLDHSLQATVVRFAERRLAVKCSRGLRVGEFYAQWLVWKFATGARVPAVYAWVSRAEPDSRYSFIYMELIEGVTLTSRWPSLSPDERVYIAQRLREMLDSVRRDVQIPQVDWYIGSIPRKPCYDRTLRNLATEEIGPSASVKAFHDQLITLGLFPGRPALPNDPQELRNILPDDARVVFSHSNLHFTNILISPPDSEKLDLLAIIDWENAGFFPDYWEWIQVMKCEGGYRSDSAPFVEVGFPGRPQNWEELWDKFDTWLYDLHA